MRRFYVSALVVVTVALVPAVGSAQQQQDEARKVAGGGVSVQGWQGQADNGASTADSKFAKEGNGFRVVTGPATNYWNPANKASGDYTVKATFTEPKFQDLNDHPHPYGLFIGGNDLGTPNATLLYCAAQGSGAFIVRGFGPAPFRMNGGRAEANEAVHKAAGLGQPVTQEIALSVKGDKVECAINGKVVASYDKSAVVGAGKLKSTDGVYGIRSAHNTDVVVTGLVKQ